MKMLLVALAVLLLLVPVAARAAEPVPSASPAPGLAPVQSETTLPEAASSPPAEASQAGKAASPDMNPDALPASSKSVDPPADGGSAKSGSPTLTMQPGTQNNPHQPMWMPTYIGLYTGFDWITDTNVTTNGVTTNNVGIDMGGMFGGKAGWALPWVPKWLTGEFNVWADWTGSNKLPVNNLTLVNFSTSLLVNLSHDRWHLAMGGGILGTVADLSDGSSDTDAAVGAIAQAIVEYDLLRPFTVFGEYRFSWNDFTFNVAGTKTEFDLARHQFIGGVNYRF